MQPADGDTFPGFRTAEGRARFLAAYDAALAEWPVPFETMQVPTRLGTTHVVVSGPPDAPPLVLLPSFAGTALAWRLNAAGLNGAYRTYAVDVVGQPGKSVTTRRIRNRRQFAGWLADLLDGLGVARASIVGCSFGGFLALNQALETPERVDKVVVISPAGVFSSQYWKLTYLMRIKAPLAKLARRLGGRGRKPGLADLRARQAFVPPRDGRWSAVMATTMAEAPKVSVIRTPVFSRAQLRSIRAPTLLLIGARETLYPPEATLAMAKRRMPGLRGDVVPDADHIAAMAQPEDVNARILAFLAEDGAVGA